MIDIDDRIGAFHGQDVADRRGIRIGQPALPVGVELAHGPDHPQQPAALEQLVIGELAAGRRRGDFLVGEVEVQSSRPVVRPSLGTGPGQQGRLTGRDRTPRISGSVVVARPRAG